MVYLAENENSRPLPRLCGFPAQAESIIAHSALLWRRALHKDEKATKDRAGF